MSEHSTTLLRQSGPAGLGTPFGPKPQDSTSIGQECPACGYPFREGDYTVLVGLGPGMDGAERTKCAQGRPYTGTAIEVHHECATGETVQGRIARGAV